MTETEIVPLESIQERIFMVRGRRVMLDADLARFYGVTTGNLNKAVSRNPERFPADFAFKLNREETAALIFQIGRSKQRRGGARKPATVFTEQGVAILASVLRTRQAALVSVAIVRAFVRLRELLANNRHLAAKLAELEQKLTGHDLAIQEVFAAIRRLLAPGRRTSRREMGFHARLLKQPKRGG
jgi:hypothetical protein